MGSLNLSPDSVLRFIDALVSAFSSFPVVDVDGDDYVVSISARNNALHIARRVVHLLDSGDADKALHRLSSSILSNAPYDRLEMEDARDAARILISEAAESVGVIVDFS